MKALAKKFRCLIKKQRKKINHIQGVGVYFISLLLVWMFAPLLFSIGYLAGAGFLLCCAVALYQGSVLKQPSAVALIGTGYIVSSKLAHTLIPEIYQSVIAQSFVTASILALFFSLLYLHGRNIRLRGMRS